MIGLWKRRRRYRSQRIVFDVSYGEPVSNDAALARSASIGDMRESSGSYPGMKLLSGFTDGELLGALTLSYEALDARSASVIELELRQRGLIGSPGEHVNLSLARSS